MIVKKSHECFSCELSLFTLRMYPYKPSILCKDINTVKQIHAMQIKYSKNYKCVPLDNVHPL